MTESTFAWDATIAEDKRNDYPVLPDGTYEFEIRNVVKSTYTPKPGSKIPACNMAKIQIQIEDKEGKRYNVFSNLFLCDSQKWKLINFFKCIGVMKPSETTLHMNWDIIGEIGKAEIGTREYNGKKSNEVRTWIVPQSSDNEELPF